MKSRILVMPGISHHRVTEPPRLVRIAVPDDFRWQGSPAISAMRYVAVGAAVSTALWVAILAAVF